jgi:WD40 repeat protein
VQLLPTNGKSSSPALSRPGETTTALAFTSSGDHLAIGTQSGKIFLGHVKPGNNFTDRKISEAAVTDVIFAPDGATLFYSTQGGTVHFIDVKSGRELFKFVADQGGILSRNLALNTDGRLLLVGAGKTAQIWDIAARRRLQTLTGHSDDVYAGAFSLDGRFILTASGFGHARGQAPVDGNAVRVWDAKTGRELVEYRAAAGPVTQVFFGADATTIYSVSWDNLIRIYRCELCAELPALITLAKKRAGRELTAEEKSRYLPVSWLPW